MSTIDVSLPVGPYQIQIRPGLLSSLGEIVRQVAPHTRALLAVDSSIRANHAPIAQQSLADAGYQVTTIEVVAEESSKTLDTVRGLYDAMLGAHLERNSPVIALGGGIVGDTAGFAAATYLRGVPLVQAPTTLLAMVDAAIGGKTGVNLPLPNGETGKNLAGAFWQPRAVVADPEVLRTLAERDLRCGLAESVKHGLIADVDLLTQITEQLDAIETLDMDVMTPLIARSATVKADIVIEDEREAGRRALLNLGHTFAHAIEPIASLDLRHGEAVAIGLCAAAHCAVQTDRLSEDDANMIEDLLEMIELPTRISRAVPVAKLMDAMGYDKKIADGKLRLVLPEGLGSAVIVDDVPTEVIESAWAHLGAHGGDDAVEPTLPSGEEQGEEQGED